MHLTRWLALAALMAVGAGGELAGSGTSIKVEHCLVSLIQNVQVPAQEAGVLVDLSIKEGDQVQAGTLLGRVNDRPSQLQKRAALGERAISAEKAASDVNVRYADAARRAAASEHQLNTDANNRVPGTKSLVEMQKLVLTVEQSTLQMEQARHEQKLAALETDVNDSKVELTDDDIQRRQLRAPLNGQVVEVLVQPGEWVQPGDPVVRVIRMDRLRIEGFVNAERVNPAELAGQAVLASVRLAHGQVETFAGRVVFVDPRVQAGGEYRFWAEVDNRFEADHWLLRPGLEATMNIETKR